MLYIYIWVINYLCSFKISTLICSNPNIILSVVFDSFRVIGVFRWRVQIHIQHTRSTVIMQIIQPFGWIPKGNGAEMCLVTLVLDLGCLTFDIGFPTLTFDSQCSALTLNTCQFLTVYYFSLVGCTPHQHKASYAEFEISKNSPSHSYINDTYDTWPLSYRQFWLDEGSVNKKCYTLCLVLVSSKKGSEHDFTIEVNSTLGLRYIGIYVK